MKGLMMPTVKHVEDLMTRNQGKKIFITGIPSGYDVIDEKTAGFQRGDLIIIAGPAVDGEDGVRAQHRRERGDPAQPRRRGVVDRDEQGAARPAPAVLADAGAAVPRAQRQSVVGRLQAPGPEREPALQRADHDRRLAGADRARDPREVPPAQSGGPPRSRVHRLPAAHPLDVVGREPRAGDLADHPLAQGARQGAGRAGRRAVAAVARGRAAPRQGPAAAALRSARVRRASSRTRIW